MPDVIPARLLLWIRRAEKLEVPTVLMTSLPPRDIAAWKRHNAWAEMIPVVCFGAPDELPPGARRFGDFSGEASQVPSAVENPPPMVVHVVTLTDSFVVALERYLLEVRRVAAALPKGARVWILGADSDQGALAVAVAAELGHAVALAASDPRTLAASLAMRWGVSISVRASSGDHRR